MTIVPGSDWPDEKPSEHVLVEGQAWTLESTRAGMDAHPQMFTPPVRALLDYAERLTAEVEELRRRATVNPWA